MLILGIETSCDETAVCIVSATGDKNTPAFSVLGNALNSQIKIHEQYGGVFPALAKREHSRNLIPLFKKTLEESGFGISNSQFLISNEQVEDIKAILTKEPELQEQFLAYLPKIEKPSIDAIAVTVGPGLEPALWVGINFARALSLLWNIPIIPVNHMEGHIVSVLVDREITKSKFLISDPQTKDRKLSTNNSPILFPALALLISGGHTELILIESWGTYTNIGQTRDDAVGEAFDKVARMLGLPYPGGPEISRLATKSRFSNTGQPTPYPLPRPMLHTKDFDFSFSGLKTAVLYLTQELKTLTEKDKEVIAREFEDAVTEVLVTKTKKALEHYGAQTLIIGGGVIANTHIRKAFEALVTEHPHIKLFFPSLALSTDNAVMIACAGYMQHLTQTPDHTATPLLVAKGNLSF
ncbi:MAG: hypothetical protein RLZZ347_312 [Candidatus Parcubacteria bacterium]